jgi:hypothetical protein
MRFMLIHYLDETTLPWTEDEDRALEAWDAEMDERGILVGGGRLRPPGETTTLQVRGGELLRTDGPFAETKEQIAGYSELECTDLEQAIEVSARHPTAALGTFELRPYQD